MGKKVYEALQWASSFLEEAGYEGRIGVILMLHHTGWSRSMLFGEYRSVLPVEVWVQFREDVEIAAGGVPVQYITGVEEFYGREFFVDPNVLIPRPETEELVEMVLELVRGHLGSGPLKIVDVGTGSGIIAISLCLELGDADVHAVDISSGALEVARRNAKNLGAKVTFHEGDLLDPFLDCGESVDVVKKFNVIVSNPPYIPEGDRSIMRANVLDHEPDSALFAGVDGLDIYGRLVRQIPSVLDLDLPGLVAFEIGHGQGEAVSRLLQDQLPTALVEVKNDINGKERIVFAVVK
ncbi:MAG: peptide chain release factor N(5)-glutamine methyltransferase [Bacillus sp. (in: Bacteria)]|nr:peptide chain release factor N(5)-glutamine methyltransferase [Bacillus sp. (in: firmicutes)]